MNSKLHVVWVQLDQARQQAMDEGDRRRRVQSAYDKLKGELGSLRSQTELDDRRERESELVTHTQTHTCIGLILVAVMLG